MEKRYPNHYKIIPIIATSTYLLTLPALMLLLYIYKILVICYLKITLGAKFNGLITGCDVGIPLYPKEPQTINIRLEIESELPGDDLYYHVCNKIETGNFEKKFHGRLHSIHKVAFGYLYFEECDMHADECVKKFELARENMSKADLFKVYTEISEKPLPRSNQFTWDLHFITTPIKHDGKNMTYMMILRIKHSVGDGLAMYNMFTSTLCRNGNELDDYAIKLAKPQSRSLQQKPKNAKIQTFFPSCEPPNNIICNQTPHFESILTSYEATDEEVMQKIKFCKNGLGVSFMEVLLLLYSASLADYYIKYGEGNVPEKILSTTPLQLDSERFKKFYSFEPAEECNNDHSVLAYYLPIVPWSKVGVKVEDYLQDRLRMIRDEFKKILESYDLQVSLIIFKAYLELLPYSFLLKVNPASYCTSIFTNIPGGPKLHLFNGDPISNLTFSIPRNSLYGLGISILTYDDRLSITVLGNKDKFKSHEKLDEIWQGMLKHLDVLCLEIVDHI